MGEIQLEGIVTQRDRFAGASPALDRAGLIARKANAGLCCGQGGKPTIGTTKNGQRPADHSVSVTMDKVVTWVATEDVQSCNAVRYSEAFAQKGIYALRNPRDVSDHHCSASHPVQ
mmetsp:Transcript_13015/g.24426  ORF Transcript_13015/g.24426 Transcript_13015/m.24426 type:complete len:116 (+) Transcript_13015:1298-1645(+)